MNAYIVQKIFYMMALADANISDRPVNPERILIILSSYQYLQYKNWDEII